MSKPRWFKHNLRREAKGPHQNTLHREFVALIERLANDEPLAARLRDHALTCAWKDHRDGHLRPDLVLVYRKPNANVLQLVRLGSHSELGW